MENDNLFKLLQNVHVKLMLYVSKIVYPNQYCAAFPLYMFVQYFRIKQQEKCYKARKMSSEFILNNFKKHIAEFIDENCAVMINNKYLKGRIFFVLLVANTPKRVVNIFQNKSLKNDEIMINSTLMFNLENELIGDIQIKPIAVGKISFAKEIELALVNIPSDIDNCAIDSVIRNYFSQPRLVHKNDLIEIDLNAYSDNFPCNFTKIMNFSTKIFIKCVNISNEKFGNFAAIPETTIKRVANLQSFVPENYEIYSKDCQETINRCPDGLIEYFEEIESAAKPFLSRRDLVKLRLRPCFSLIGDRGCGKEILINSLALKLGMNFYNVVNFDVTAQIYAQNETKLKNIFFNAKLCAPCIIYMKNFENFEKNNDGASDERIISHFINSLQELFENNEFPIILFCSSNTEDISPLLKREFLEIFRIEALTEEQRLNNLKWLIKTECSNYSIPHSELIEIAQKTNTFHFEDLKALIRKSKGFALTNNTRNLMKSDIISALDYMRANYSEEIGAPKVPEVRWEDIGGLGEVKREIIKTINFPLRHPKLLAQTGLSTFGILLFGPPGTGKTLLAKAVATECNLNFLSVKGPELLNMYIGQSEGNIREVFEKARASSPCIIFFDELDSLAPNRGVSGDSGGVMDRVVSQLLTELDGINKKATIFVIGATNRPDLIDPALLRPGRFDKMLYVGPSMDYDSRLSVLRALTRKFKLDENLSLEKVVEICPENISGADFYGICSSSWMNAVRRIIEQNEQENFENLKGCDVVVTFEDFEKAMEDVKPSISQKDLRYFEKLRREIGSNE